MPAWNLVLYAYRRSDLTLEVYRDRIEITELGSGVALRQVYRLGDIVTVRATASGRLVLDLVDGSGVGYELGPTARDMCDLLAGLL